MSLITKEVWVGLSNNISYYENLNYEIPRFIDKQGRSQVKRGTKILVKVKDLSDGSGVFVDVECDGCGEIINITWVNYKKHVKEDGKYYCKSCIPQERIDKRLKTMLDKSISFYQWCYDNLPKEVADYILSRWDYKLNIKNGKILTPKDVSYKSAGFNKKGYWFKCIIHPEHVSEQKHIGNFTSGQEGSLNCNQCNTLSITHPELIKKLVNPEDAFKYSMGSNEKILIKCLDCGHIKSVIVSDFIRNNYHCDVCSDKLPYNEKFITCLLRQLLDDDFVIQLSKMNFKWCDKYRYDNYINNINCILETHGLQHYEEHKSNCWGTLEEIQENDFDKEWLARSNNIKNYIILDCRKSELEWIKNSIMKSRLPKLLNFKEEDIDWLECHEYACSSLVKITCDLWNKGMQSVPKLKEEMGMGDCAIGGYLKRGTELGWCVPPYSPIEAMYVLRKKIICVTTGEIFESITDVSVKLNIHETTISQCCKHKSNRTAGKDAKTGEKLVWMFYDKYITKTKEEIENILNDAQDRVQTLFVKVVCLTTGEIFNSQVEAEKKYNISASNISRCCIGKQKTAGIHPETEKRLVWMYYDEYINKDKNEIDLIYNKKLEKPIYKTQKIICLTTDEIFDSIRDAQIKYNIEHITNACQGKNRYAGKHPETSEKMVWMYYEEYILKTEKEIETIINKAGFNYRNVTNKVKCLTTNEIFNSTLDASDKYKISQSGIYKCCTNKQKSCGKHPITGDPMIWNYLQ